MEYLQLFGGLTYLLLAGDLLVRGAVALARKAGIPPMVVGLTVVAFGTSAPELFVCVSAVHSGYPGISIGNVVGSNIANVLLVLGLPALIHPTVCNQPSVRRDASTMLLASVGFVLLCTLGPLGRVDGALLSLAMLAFLVAAMRRAAPEAGTDAAAEQELERVLGLPTQKRTITLFLLLGGVGLPLGADLMVDGAVAIARSAGVSHAVIGLTVVALGTSLPELATTVVAALHRHPDVAVGNVLGSNVFNLLAIMGITAGIAPAPIPVPPAFLALDLPVMLAAALGLSLYAWSHGTIGRRGGALFVTLYALYVAVLFGLPSGV